MSKKNTIKGLLGAAVATLIFAAGSNSAFAQVKIGSNPTVIGANSNLEVEATSGNKTVIQKDNGNVGIGTDAPGAKLHVAGNQILGTADVVPNSTGNSQVVRDNATGELKVLQTTSTNSFPINNVTYQLNNVDRDWVSNFDTKISNTDYVVIITGLTLSPNTLTPNTANSFNALNFRAFVQNGTWRLYVDYAGATTLNDANGNWTVNCLVINRSIIQQLSTQTFNLAGQNTGAAAAAPSGL